MMYNGYPIIVSQSITTNFYRREFKWKLKWWQVVFNKMKCYKTLYATYHTPTCIKIRECFYMNRSMFRSLMNYIQQIKESKL